MQIDQLNYQLVTQDIDASMLVGCVHVSGVAIALHQAYL